MNAFAIKTESSAKLDPSRTSPTMTPMMICGIVVMAFGSALDTIFRLRMTRLGHTWLSLRGGTFNYKEYHQVRRLNGWSAWPV